MQTFKPGDRVRRKDGGKWGGGFGEPDYDVVTVEKVEHSRFSGTMVFAKETGTWREANTLELATETKPSVDVELGGPFTGKYRTTGPVKRTWIIAVLDKDGNPRPNTKASTYVSLAQAEAVARKMAEEHPGETFMVFQAVAVAALPKEPQDELVRL